MCVKLSVPDPHGDVSEDVSAAQAVEVEQHVSCMPCELDAAVCCAAHTNTLLRKTQKHTVSSVH